MNGGENMKKQLFLVMALVVVVIVAAVPALAQVRPNVAVAGFEVVNGTASVGKSFVLAVRLIDTEPSACAVANTATLSGDFPFIFRGVSSVAVGDICPGAGTLVYFPMRIDPTAVGGTYQLSVTNNFETTTLAQFTTTGTINLFVNGAPELHATITGSSPLDVYPGDTATLSVSVQNDGSFQAQSVEANLSARAPIEVVWSTARASLGSLDARQGKTAPFAVDVPKNAPAVDYPLVLRLSYLDSDLVAQQREIPLTLHVKPKALFETADAGSDALYADQSTRTVRLLLENTGTDAARRLRAKILPTYPFSTDGSVRYVDVIEPGQNASVVFTLNVDKDAQPGAYGLDLLVDFEDDQGKNLQDTAKVALSVRSKNIFRAVFYDYWYVWLAVLLIVFLVVRGKRKAAKKK
jgi:hypothetical protein